MHLVTTLNMYPDHLEAYIQLVYIFIYVSERLDIIGICSGDLTCDAMQVYDSYLITCAVHPASIIAGHAVQIPIGIISPLLAHLYGLILALSVRTPV